MHPPKDPLIQEQISLKDKNWFQTGGIARYFAEPKNEQEFQQLLLYTREHNLELVVIGQGANILMSDQGFDGLVIRPQLKAINHRDQGTHELVTVGAGWTMHDFIDYCLDHQLGGLEEFSGIPGTIGGSVYINLHYFEFLLEHFITSARVINKQTGQFFDVDRNWFHFGYDQSKLIEKEYFLVSATFSLKKMTSTEVMYARGRRVEIIRHRHKRYPTTHTCGSFFRNFHDNEVNLVINNKKMIFAAYYLDKIGVKGALRIGDAIVSHQHANMIVNQGNATSTDIINLARSMQQLVHQHFGIMPQPECQLIGFRDYPLLPAIPISDQPHSSNNQPFG